MISKHERSVWELLEFKNIKSTNQILDELQKKVKKVINWHMVYRILKKLEEEGKIERLENISGIFWRKK